MYICIYICICIHVRYDPVGARLCVCVMSVVTQKTATHCNTLQHTVRRGTPYTHMHMHVHMYICTNIYVYIYIYMYGTHACLPLRRKGVMLNGPSTRSGPFLTPRFVFVCTKMNCFSILFSNLNHVFLHCK